MALCSDLVVGAQGLLPVFSTNPESHKFGSAVAQQTAGSVLPILLFRISPETIPSEQSYFLARLIVSLRRHFFLNHFIQGLVDLVELFIHISS